jgi:hypothetical protein
MTWCLTKQAEKALLKALQEDGDPQKMVDRGPEGRLAWLAKYVGTENAQPLNYLFETKMLLKNQQRGFESFVKYMGGSREIKTDFLTKVGRLQTALSKKEINQYLETFVSQRLGTKITESEFKVLGEMSDKLAELQKSFDTKKQEWINKEDAKKFASLQVAFENYVNDLKTGNEGIREMLRGRTTQFKEEFAKNKARAIGKLVLDSALTIANTSVEAVATFDNSFFGRQGVFTLWTGHPVIWGRAFAKSFIDIVKTFGGKNTSDALRAQLYQDPLYMTGEYQKAGIIDMNEEQYPASWLEKLGNIGQKNLATRIGTSPLWVTGRGIQAAAAAFKNGGLRMRTELYKVLRDIKTSRGIEMTKEQIQGTGTIVNSTMARGNLGRAGQNPIVRLLMWAPKMLKADIDILTAHAFDDIPVADRKTAFGNLIKIIIAVGIINALDYLKNGKFDELDPRSSDFLKSGGKYGYLRGVPQVITLLTRLVTREYKNANGEIIKYEPGIGKRSRLDAVYSFFRGKAPPATASVYDWLAGADYQGNPPTFSSELLQHGVAISLQNLLKLSRDPSIDNAFGVIGDFFGFNANITPDPNTKSELIPIGKPQKSSDVIEILGIYAKAISSDPETAFNRFFTGQKILRVTNGAIIVERMSVGDSQAYKKKYGADTIQVKLDHTIPLELGGSNNKDNLKLVTTSEWESYTKVENALGKALKAGKISKKDAQAEIIKFKNISDSGDRKKYGEELVNKYK